MVEITGGKHKRSSRESWAWRSSLQRAGQRGFNKQEERCAFRMKRTGHFNCIKNAILALKPLTAG